MINIEDFILGEEAASRMNDEAVINQYLQEGKPLQDLFGFSDDATAEFYETAKNILEQKRYDDAVDAFTFLTTINPYISDFWMGLGMAQQQNNAFDEANVSYSVAYTLEGDKIFPYMLAAECYLDVKDFDKALETIDLAKAYAEEHPDEDEIEQLVKDAEAARNYVVGRQEDT